MRMTLQEAFGWSNDIVDKVVLLATVLTNESRTLKDIVDGIKNQDSDNDITDYKNWWKYCGKTILSNVKDIISDKLSTLDSESLSYKALKNLKDNASVSVNDNNYTFNCILDVLITTKDDYNSLANKIISDIQNVETYWKIYFPAKSDGSGYECS